MGVPLHLASPFLSVSQDPKTMIPLRWQRGTCFGERKAEMYHYGGTPSRQHPWPFRAGDLLSRRDHCAREISLIFIVSVEKLTPGTKLGMFFWSLDPITRAGCRLVHRLNSPLQGMQTGWNTGYCQHTQPFGFYFMSEMSSARSVLCYK